MFRFVRERVLELDWSPPGEPQSVVRIELVAEGERTLLVLDHATTASCGARADGRRRLYSLDPGPLEKLDAWLDHYSGFWKNRLAALDTEVKPKEEALMQSIVPYLLYKDCDVALEWLSRAFGFEEVLRYSGAEGYVERAKAAGAEILQPAADQEYGDRRYDVADAEGHRRCFASHIREAAPEDWGATVS